jgi:hypothetical protein
VELTSDREDFICLFEIAFKEMDIRELFVETIVVSI